MFNIFKRKTEIKEDLNKVHYFREDVGDDLYGPTIIMKIFYDHESNTESYNWGLYKYDFDNREFTYRSSSNTYGGIMDGHVPKNAKEINGDEASEIINKLRKDVDHRSNNKSFKYFLVSGDINNPETTGNYPYYWRANWSRFSHVVRVNKNGGWGQLVNGEYVDLSAVSVNAKIYYMMSRGNMGQEYKNITVKSISKKSAAEFYGINIGVSDGRELNLLLN